MRSKLLSCRTNLGGSQGEAAEIGEIGAEIGEIAEIGAEVGGAHLEYRYDE